MPSPQGDGDLAAVFRSATRVVFFALSFCVLPLNAQDANALSNYFTGKEVVLKLDMPGTQQGVDLSSYVEGLVVRYSISSN